MKSVFVALFSILALLLFDSEIIAQNMFRKVSDFDGDGKADYAVTRNQNNLKFWYLWQSAAGFKAVQWGTITDINAASDYDGDGRADFAVYREPTGFPPTYSFYVLESQAERLSFWSFSGFSNLGSTPMHQDYNGDGKTDFAVRTGEFGLTTILDVRFSGNGNLGFVTTIPAGEVPIRIGDMSGDERAEIAHFTLNGNVVTIRNRFTNTARTVQFGQTGDRYQMADFDGDGVGDLTIWRPTNGFWFWLRSSDDTLGAMHWGQNGDLPVPADYDGDGKTDFAIYRTGSPGYYWIYSSRTKISAFPWGAAGDVPVQF